MSEITINLTGHLADVKPGDKLFYAVDDDVIEVYVVSIELTLCTDGYHPTWINCNWMENQNVMTKSISVCCLFRDKEEALKYQINEYKNYIGQLNDRKAQIQVKIMDLEEKITQLHV